MSRNHVTQIDDSTKYCIDCNHELVIGTNWTECQKEKYCYVCRDCNTKRTNDRIDSEPEKYKDIQRKAQEKYRSTIKGRRIRSKADKKYKQSKKGILNDHKHQSKRRKLGHIPMFANHFNESVKVHDHHMTDVYTVAIPTDIHDCYKGYSRERHRELVMSIAKQIYLEGD